MILGGGPDLKKELKQQIKQDELLSRIGQAWTWLQANRATAQRFALVALGLIVLVVGALAFQSHRTHAANLALDAAQQLYETPLASEVTADSAPPGSASFPSAAEKYKKAAAAFDGVERAFPTLAAGLRARYFGALCRIELGDYETARKTLQVIADRQQAGALEPTLARLALADIARRTGAVDKALESYRALADDASGAVPRDHALMTLAVTLEDASRRAEACASYERLVEQFPNSVYAAEARRRASYLRSDDQA